jgi:Fe-S-cluster-containing hydrogenase component 2
MNKALVIEPDKCTSCRLCELACSERNADAYRPSRSRIQVSIRVDQALYFPRACFQCDEAPCIDACPSGALVRNPDGNVVVVIEELCNECQLCETACPYGVIRCLDGKARKCELCGGDPECVRFCAFDALTYQPMEPQTQARRQVYAGRLRELCAEERR